MYVSIVHETPPTSRCTKHPPTNQTHLLPLPLPPRRRLRRRLLPRAGARRQDALLVPEPLDLGRRLLQGLLRPHALLLPCGFFAFAGGLRVGERDGEGLGLLLWFCGAGL